MAGRPGRPRDPARDDAILEATQQVLADHGFAGLRVEDVAARAAASKATIYRRWPSLTDLATAALQRYAEQQVRGPDTGSLRGDLVALSVDAAAALRGPGGRVVTEMLAASRRDEELGRLLRHEVVARRRRTTEDLLRRAVDRGELPPDADVTGLSSVPFSLVFYRALMTDDPVDRVSLERLVDQVVLPALGARPPG